MAHRFDLVVRGGTVADGTGARLREADIAIDGGRIAAIGEIAGSGREEIAANGLLVTPGFVDIHTHFETHIDWRSSDVADPERWTVSLTPGDQRELDHALQTAKSVSDNLLDIGREHFPLEAG